MLSPMNSPRYVILRPTLIGRKADAALPAPPFWGKAEIGQYAWKRGCVRRLVTAASSIPEMKRGTACIKHA